MPRVWEKLKVAIEMAVDREPDDTRRQGMQWALDVADRRAGYMMTGDAVPSDLETEHAKAEELVLAPLRAKLGLGEVRWAISGAAPIPISTLKFFTGLGIPIAEIWGMSEVTCIATAAWPDPTKLGTVGKAVPGTELKLAADGELLLRGPLVMKGYRNEPEKTAEAIDADGWLYTGDIATIDDDGYVRIVDRKKEIIINAAGKNMSPSNIENAVKSASPLVGPLVAIGDALPYNTALITLDPEAAAGYAAKVGLADASPAALTTDPGVVDQIKAAVAAGNEKLARVEQIKRFRILPTYWEPGSDEVTLTMKLKRKPIAVKYADEIDSLYVDSPGPDVHEPAPAPAPTV